MKKLLIGLFFVLGLFFAMTVPVQATEYYNLWVGGVQVTDTNKDGVTGEGIEGTVTYDPVNKILTLDNARITGVYTDTATYYVGNTYGIYFHSINLKINLVGNNSIEIPANPAPSASSSGINQKALDASDLTIQGDGNLTVSVGPARYVYCINSSRGTTTIGGEASLTLQASSAARTGYGIFHESARVGAPYAITIREQAQVTIEAAGGPLSGDAIGSNSAILITGDAVVNATVLGTTIDNTGHTSGISSSNGMLVIADHAVVTAAGSATSGEYSYSYGIRGSSVEVLDSAQVSASGGHVVGTGSNSYGVFGSTGVTISDDAQVTATGGTAANGDSYGIGCSDGDSRKIQITGGIIEAQGNTRAYYKQPVDGSDIALVLPGWDGTAPVTYPPAPVYSISLDQNETYTFPTSNPGYEALTALSVTVTNDGNQPTGELTVALSGANADSFNLSKTTIPSLAVSGTDSFSLAPVSGLAAGTYIAIVTVSGSNGISESFDVSFTVQIVDYYDLWVGGVQVTSLNKDNVTGPGISGTVSYDPDNKILTLDNADITGAPDSLWSSGNVIGIYYETDSLTINLVGTNSLNVPYRSGFYIVGIKGDHDYNALCIQGSGTLDIRVEEESFGSTGIDILGTVTIGDNATVAITAGSTGIYCGKKDEHVGTYPPRTITIEDNVQVSIALTNESSGRSRGIYCDNDILITDSARVDVAMDDAPYSMLTQVAIYAGEQITISGQAEVTALAGNDSYWSIGIEGAVVEVLNRAQLTAAGGNSDIEFGGTSIGILVDCYEGSSISSSFAIADTAQVMTTGGSTTEYGLSYGIGCIGPGFIYYDESMDFRIILEGGTIRAQGQTGAFICQPVDSSGTPLDIPGWDGSALVTYPSVVYSIALNKSGTHTFAVQTVGYGAQSPLTVTATNTGNQATGNLTVSLSGANAGSYTLSAAALDSIAVSGTDSFTIVPNTGLATGTYTATVTVSGSNGISESFAVSFTVNSSRGSNGGGSNGSSSGSDTPVIISRTDSSTGITAEGNLSGALEVKPLLEAGSGAANEVVGPATFNELKVTVDDGYTVVGAYEVRLTSFSGDLTLSFPVAAEHNGKGFVVVHKTASGRIINYTGTVENGKITIKVTELSPFMIAVLEPQVTSTPGTKTNNPFSDVRESDWFYNTVLQNLEKGLLKGTSASTFSPGAPMTRGMFAAVLARIDGADLSGFTSAKFTDVDMSKYYGPSVVWAAETGIITGYGNGRFGAEDGISREQMAAMLANYIRIRNVQVAAARPEVVKYSDDSQICSWARDSVYKMQVYSLIGGRPGSLYDPKNIATRAEVTQVLINYDKAVK